MLLRLNRCCSAMTFCRFMSAASAMKHWQLSCYDNSLQNLEMSSSRIPAVSDPNDVLIAVKAASINKIDVAMAGGYGRQIINKLRRLEKKTCQGTEFPLTLGRDCSGTVVATGKNVSRVQPGDEVWSSIGIQRQGTHSDYVLSRESWLSKKPENFSHVESASLPYVANTVWSAVTFTGGLDWNSTQGKRVLVLGGMGGIGNFAIQLFKAWRAEVTTLCSTDSVDLMASLGADHIIDYKLDDVKSVLEGVKGFDFILDNIGHETYCYVVNYLKPWKNCKYVSISTPLMEDTDKYGIMSGLVTSVGSLGIHALQALREGKLYRWAFFRPDGRALSEVAALVEKGLVKPVVQETYHFTEVPAAYLLVKQGHLRGKIVINMQNER